MNTLMSVVRPITLLMAALAVSACTPGGTVALVGATNVATNNAQTRRVAVVTVGIPEHRAPSGQSALSSIPPLKIRLLPFNDDRKEIDIEGKATAAFGVPTGSIRFDPSPATLLGKAMLSELKAAGHPATDGADGTPIAGAVLRFETHTDTTLLYWDVIGHLAASLQFPGAQGTAPGAPLEYHARCLERTYIGPSEAVIAGVMSKCISDFADKLRNDGRAAAALRNAAKATTGGAKVAREPREVAAQPRAANLKSYSNPDRRWTISYPGDWKLDAEDRFVRISRGTAIVGIHAISDGAGKSLDEVTDATIKRWEQQMQNVNIVKRVSRQRVTLADDLTAIAIEHHIGQGRVGKSRKVIAVAKDRGFLIDAETNLASWSDYEREFNQILDSFRVLD